MSHTEAIADSKDGTGRGTGGSRWLQHRVACSGRGWRLLFPQQLHQIPRNIMRSVPKGPPVAQKQLRQRIHQQTQCRLTGLLQLTENLCQEDTQEATGQVTHK